MAYELVNNARALNDRCILAHAANNNCLGCLKSDRYAIII